jgi:ribosomal protein S12 methylthiotransferase accessory factor
MDRVLRLKHHLRAEVVGDELVFLIGELERFLLRGRLYGLVVPRIDGRRTVEELIEDLEGRASPSEVYYTVTMLEEKGYLTEVRPDPPPEVAAFWHSLGTSPEQVTDRLAATPVRVQAMGEEDPRPVVAALAEAGIEVREQAPIWLVVTDDYLAPELDGVNRRARLEQACWMLVKPTGAAPWIGPMFHPDAGPCWACLAARLRDNRPVEAFLERCTRATTPIAPPRAGVSASARAALGLAGLALARWIAGGGRGELDGKLLALDLAGFRIRDHTVVRRPQCAVCGDPEMIRTRAAAPVVLGVQPKRFTDDGGHRAARPRETLERYEHQVSPITGALSSLGPVQGRNHPLRPVYGASFFVCPAGDDPSFDDFSQVSSGKGRTPDQARASALCEALERYSALFRGDEPRIRACLAELGDEGIHPDALQNFSELQFRTRNAANAGIRDRKRLVPLPFDERVAIDWTPVWSLTHGRRRYVPTAYCYLHTPVPPEERFCYLNPNGHAAGNCLEEAILQGFLELCERDAVALWWYNRIRRPGVSLQSFEEPYFQALSEHYRAMGYQLWLLDLTNDLEIPTFVALARALDTGRFCVGFGCHFEARLGAQRALTELNQLFDPERRAPAPWDASAIEDPSYLVPDEAVRRRVQGDFPELRSDDLRSDVLACVERATRVGLETLVLDQTRPDVGLSAVKVIVPGLRHFWPRFGPGRLYEAPVRLGWLDRPRDSAALNPIALYL